MTPYRAMQAVAKLATLPEPEALERLDAVGRSGRSVRQLLLDALTACTPVPPLSDAATPEQCSADVVAGVGRALEEDKRVTIERATEAMQAEIARAKAPRADALDKLDPGTKPGRRKRRPKSKLPTPAVLASMRPLLEELGAQADAPCVGEWTCSLCSGVIHAGAPVRAHGTPGVGVVAYHSECVLAHLEAARAAGVSRLESVTGTGGEDW